MFFHNFKYTLKTLVYDKMLIFWTFAFPIIMGIFFYMAFSNIENSEKFEIFSIAIVKEEGIQPDLAILETFEYLSQEDKENQLFHLQYVTEEEAKELLELEKIEGYLKVEDTLKVIVKQDGVNATILKYVTEEIIENEDIINTIIQNKMQGISLPLEEQNLFYQNIYNEVLRLKENASTNIQDISSEHLSYTMIEYYTLMAMTCLYGGILGMTAMNNKLANMSNKGKRVSISPVTKRKLIFSSLCASYLIEVLGVILLFVFFLFFLKIDFGSHLPLVLLTVLIGSLAGLTLGLAIASIIKGKEGAKVGIIIALSMLGSFFSGMMGPQIKYMFDKSIPLINKINPASMITDAFYSLYYYDTMNRFYFNIMSLLVFSLLLLFLSVCCLRRQKYDSI